MTDKSKLLNVILFCTVVFVLSAAFVLLPDRDFSAVENRALAPLPELDSDSFFSGEFAADINTYYADQFPLRDYFVGAKALVEAASLKKENNGVVIGDNGYLAVRLFDAYKSRLTREEDTDYFFEENVNYQISAINALADKLDIPLVTVVPPRTIDIARSNFAYISPTGDRLFELLSSGLSEKAGYVGLLPVLRAKHESGEYVCYKTDHHWTSLGAYYAYCEIMASLGRGDAVVPRNGFSVETIGGFMGTTAARASFPFAQSDEIELWTLGDEEEYTVVSDGVTSKGFFRRDRLETHDKYTVFLGGAHAVTEISRGENRDRLLVARDSFADSLIPFLAREYDIVAVNLTSGATNLSALAKQYECDALLIVYNAENVVTTGTLGNLN